MIVQPFTSLMERVLNETPDLLPGLQRLKSVMTDHDYEKYIDSLSSIRKGHGMLLLITRQEMFRSVIERNFLNEIKKSFDVERIRIICN